MQSSSESAELSEQQVRSELHRIVSSEPWQRSPQLQRLFRFLVEESLAGRADRLKEYVIGVEVFARPPSYDPRIDSLVRVEVKRLRAMLDQYYANDDNRNSVRIALPVGTYRPIFRVAERDVAPTRNSSRRRKWVAFSMTVLLLFAATTYFTMRARSRTPVPINTVAVLPFDNLSGDPGYDLFCFGLMDEITKELAHTNQLRVVARTSAERFKRGDDIATIARQLKADAVLEGSVSRSGDKVRIIAQLINARDETHLWSQSYLRSSADPFEVQDEVAQAVALALRGLLFPGATEPERHIRYSPNVEANQLYWKGSYLRTPMGKTGWRKDLAKSAAYFEAALQQDQNFAVAYAALADVYVSLAWERGGGPITQDLITRARHVAERGLQLDSTLAEAYGALGTVSFFYDYDPMTAERNYRRALELDPSNGKVRMWYAYALTMQRRPTEAIAEAKQAKELDPLSFMSTTHLAVVYYFSRHNEEALKLVNEMLEISDTAPGHGLRGMILETKGKYGDAIKEYQAGLQIVPQHPYIKGMLGHAYAMSGRTAEAMALLKDGGLGYDQGGLSDLKMSYIYLALGNKDEALQHLERDYESRDPELPYANADPVFDPLRDDPRFKALMVKMHMDQ